MFCRNIPPISSMQCGTVRDRLHEPFYGMFPGKKLRITEEFEKVLSLLKAKSMQSRELGIALAKSRLGLDSYDLVHRIKKLCLYHKDFEIKNFVFCLNVLESIAEGGRVESITSIDIDNSETIGFGLEEMYSLYYYNNFISYKNSNLSKTSINEDQYLIIQNAIRYQKGDFYTSFLLHFVY